MTTENTNTNGEKIQVQQINYKISIMLSSDSKSEIESLRWILIRRSVLGIIFMAVLTLGHFLLMATIVATAGWYVAGRFLRVGRSGGIGGVSAASGNS